ncbi:SHOCT domain-containing protein [Nocardioides sp. URHA0020]|uniref:SHOCT domain-containing protein n=1 Tax=Nocardioides sp. URHA0020 TaxID=1380392 RepID=UPI000A6E6804|nr:SHOCT domain-containing protein [Nocardioides sp. URHA0020]
MVTVLEYTPGDVFLSMLWFFLFFIWIWLLIGVFGDIFRSDDLGGWGKALWTLFVIVLPYLGVFVYLIARGHRMGEHAVQDASLRDQQMRSYVQSVAGSPSTAGEIQSLADLRDAGTISEAEFQQGKAKLLA